jgi:hypothetical protein
MWRLTNGPNLNGGCNAYAIFGRVSLSRVASLSSLMTE